MKKIIIILIVIYVSIFTSCDKTDILDNFFDAQNASIEELEFSMFHYYTFDNNGELIFTPYYKEDNSQYEEGNINNLYLCRFDGSNTEIIDQLSFHSGLVDPFDSYINFAVDNNDNIWLATTVSDPDGDSESGRAYVLCKYEENGNVTVFEYNKGGVPENISVDKNNNIYLWPFTTNEHIPQSMLKFNGSTWEDIDISMDHSGHRFMDSEGYIWYDENGTGVKELFRYKNSNTVETISTPVLFGENFWYVKEFNNQIYLSITDTSFEYYIYKYENNILEQVFLLPESIKTHSPFSGDFIIDKSNVLWIMTNDGIYTLSPTGEVSLKGGPEMAGRGELRITNTNDIWCGLRKYNSSTDTFGEVLDIDYGTN